MSVPFEFYLRGSSTYFAAQYSALPEGYWVQTGAADAAPNTIAGPPTTTTGWLTIQAFGADATLTNEGDEFTTGDGSVYKDSTPRWTFTIKTLGYVFPDDWQDYRDLMKHLSRPYLYITSKTYDEHLMFGNNASTNWVLPVTCEASVEHNYDNGKKYVTMTLKHRVMTEALS